MNLQKILVIASVGTLASLWQTVPAMAFNPQPDPPGKTLSKQASHPAAFDVFLPNGQRQQAMVRGNQLILIGMRGGTAPAPDGKYRRQQGSIVVQGGLIVQGGRVASPAGSRMLNPQPLPPKSKQGSALPAVQ